MPTSEPRRKRLRRREIESHVRYVTFSCYQRLPLLGRPPIRDAFADTLRRTHQALGFELFAWVVMPEHVHILIRTPAGGTWADIASSLKNSVARRILARWRRLEAPILPRLRTPAGKLRFWQHGGGFDRNVRNIAEFTKAVQYIHRNPVKRGLVERPEDWPWSSVRWWMGEREDQIPCAPPPDPSYAWHDWKGYK